MPPKQRDSASVLVEDLIIALRDERVLDAIGTVFESRIQSVLSELKEENRMLRADLKSCSDRLADVTSGITERIERIESSLEELDKKVNESPAVSTDEASKKLDAIEKETRDFRIAANDTEQYVRRMNLRIRGLTVGRNDDCRLVVTDFCRSRLHLSDFDVSKIEVAHIVPVRSGHEGDNKPRKQAKPDVIVKFRSREDRDAVIRKRKELKGTAFTVVEDLTSLNVLTLNRVRKDERVDTCWTWNGRVYALLKSGSKILVKPYQSLEDCQVL